MTPPAEPSFTLLGPRGRKGLFGWTFFDPANLVCVGALIAAAALTALAMRVRDASDWYMPLALYACIAALLRGYFFEYYHGHRFARVLVLSLLVFGLLASALLWEDRAQPFGVRRSDDRVVQVAASPEFHRAALLHLLMVATLLVHALVPRRWVIRMTDEVADRADRDTAPDAPIETIGDADERARRAAQSEGSPPAR